ncbi:MAG: SDR family oxidoreductase [Flavobacteriales bacterium]|nr:SDR family oxidoreductase [Flavobacteriales bacterium]
MKKVLITGSNGLLGQKLTNIYRAKSTKELIATGRGPDRYPEKDGYIYETLDTTNYDEVLEVFKKYRPDCVIHTAAMTNVDACELNHDECVRQNIDAVKNVVNAANEINAHLIHLSTDFIFDGTKGPYPEDSEPNPLSFYGDSKLKAEQYIMENSQKWSIARTVLVYGLVADMSRSNIVLWAKDSLENKKPISVVDDQYRTPTLAEDLAMGCYLIEDKSAEGVYNISGKDYMNIYQLVERVAVFFGFNMENVTRVSSQTLKQPAKRPPVTGFDISKAVRELGYDPHSFEEGIEVVQKQFDLFTAPKQQI